MAEVPGSIARPGAGFLRLLAIGGMSLSGVFTLLVVKVFWEGKWTWLIVYDRLGSHLPQLAVEFLPVPLAFLLWLRLVERERALPLRLSPLWILLSLAFYSAFTAATRLAGSPQVVQEWFFLREILFGAGVVAGLFATVPFRGCLERMRHSPRLTVVAIVAAASACTW